MSKRSRATRMPPVAAPSAVVAAVGHRVQQRYAVEWLARMRAAAATQRKRAQS